MKTRAKSGDESVGTDAETLAMSANSTFGLVIITKRALLDELCASLPYAKMLDKARAAFVVCGNPHKDEAFAPLY